LELKKQAPAGGLQVIQSYGDGGFKVSGTQHRGSILVLPDNTMGWSVASALELTPSKLQPIIDADPVIEILIIGCGASLAMLPLTLREVMRSKQIGVESMDTGAACRTYNVLAGEGRRVAAALIAL
jgi:uncharacterized protein